MVRRNVMNQKKKIRQRQTTTLRELIRIVNRQSPRPRILPKDKREIRLFCMVFFGIVTLYTIMTTGFLAVILSGIYMLFQGKTSNFVDRMVPYWWLPIVWVVMFAILILVIWLVRRSLVKETHLLLAHAKDEIARQYEAGNGVVSQDVINLENYVDDLQRNYQF